MKKAKCQCAMYGPENCRVCERKSSVACRKCIEKENDRQNAENSFENINVSLPCTCKKAAHTAGSWRIYNRQMHEGAVNTLMQIRDSAGNAIAEMGAEHDDPKASANACLIAAAPELLEELKLLESFAETCYRCGGSGEPQKGDYEERCEKCSGLGEIVKESIICEFYAMRKLIAKAEGRA